MYPLSRFVNLKVDGLDDYGSNTDTLDLEIESSSDVNILMNYNYDDEHACLRLVNEWKKKRRHNSTSSSSYSYTPQQRQSIIKTVWTKVKTTTNNMRNKKRRNEIQQFQEAVKRHRHYRVPSDEAEVVLMQYNWKVDDAVGAFLTNNNNNQQQQQQPGNDNVLRYSYDDEMVVNTPPIQRQQRPTPPERRRNDKTLSQHVIHVTTKATSAVNNIVSDLKSRWYGSSSS